MFYSFDAIVNYTGLSVERFAHLYSIPIRSARRWYIGAYKPPAYLLVLLSRIVEMDFPALRCESEAARIASR